MRKHIKKWYKNTKNNHKMFALWTMLVNFVWAGIKIGLGFVYGSIFFIITGLYTIFMGLGKRVFYINLGKNINPSLIQKCKLIGVFVIITSTLFTLNMLSLFLWQQVFNFSLIVSIAIAAGSFWEIGFAILQTIKAHKKKNMLLVSHKASAVASGLFAIVTTQIALLSACQINSSLYNAITGTVFGVLAVGVGVGIIIYAEKSKKIFKENEMKENFLKKSI